MSRIQRLGLVGGLLLAGAAQASDPFQQLYDNAQNRQQAKQDAEATATRSPVKAVIYGHRLPNGQVVTTCHIEHTRYAGHAPIRPPIRLPRERR